MKISDIVQKTKRLARASGYSQAAAKALRDSGFRPGQQWGVTRNLQNDLSIKIPDDRTTLLTIITSHLGKEGAQAAVRNRQQLKLAI